jgi:hypothetical protein
MPNWAWFSAGVAVALFVIPLRELWTELVESLEQTDDSVFRPWFRPFGRLMRRAGLTARQDNERSVQ